MATNNEKGPYVCYWHVYYTYNFSTGINILAKQSPPPNFGTWVILNWNEHSSSFTIFDRKKKLIRNCVKTNIPWNAIEEIEHPQV